ncbi:outer membrane protein transport protein [Desulfuromonas sp. KJ2020]|uniref:OmpP1/FadL family transporter n=1 Tax=Desulfuromonas sp. KJ2020 TaxID=2919173 RepID=UPI0020A781DA|nr:outer membrane protein transport protein [Desulfuromonas sp. KJ2020]MCP3178316.1 outer membrane protein transport protein [Desulfuromonas sp. KJ2020]
MKHFIRWFVVVSLVLALASPAFSAGFALIEQSVSGLGNAFAGAAATGEDASTIFFNPAALTLLEGQQVVAGAHVIAPSAKFSKESANNALGLPISGGNSGDAGVVGVAPNLYYAANLNNGWSVGLGIFAPFGLATEYDKDWVGRYHAVESDVMTININPTVAYRVNENLSLGAGVSAQYIDVTLSQMVDFGLNAYVGSGMNAALLPAVSNPDADIYADLTADDWGYGFNLGALYEFNENTRVGVAYRSRIKHTVKGDAVFTQQNPTYLAAFGLDGAAAASFPNQGVKGDITLPASASLSAYHRINSQWAVMADIMWTEWSTFDKLVIEFDGALPDSVTTENWDDNWRYSVGANYTPNDRLVLRGGLAYDETPIPDAKHRTPRIPGEDRFWVAFGAGYKLTDQMNIDFGYAHLFVQDSKIDKEAVGEDQSRGELVGEYENSVDIASVQLSYSF